MTARPQDPRADEKRHLLGRRSTILTIGTALVGSALIGLRSLWPRTGKASALRLRLRRPDTYTVGEVDSSLLREHWVFAVRNERGFYALSARCPHLGCCLRHTPTARELHCMCHGSTFSLEGERLRGPAARHLERVSITLGPEGTLVVDPSIRYRHEHAEWSHPGAFLRYPTRRSST